MSVVLEEIKGKTILVSALDWGMGHVTRVSAVIRVLIMNNTVVFAGNDLQNAFISKEFPEIQTETLNGYGIRLDSSKNTYLQLIRQSFRVLKAVRYENKWLNVYLKSHKIDLIVSDNRYGFYAANVESVILTHQLTLQVPFFKKQASALVQKMVSKFDACWVPDNAERRLTGELSLYKRELRVYFIGSLNRFGQVEASNNIAKRYKYLIILSGPDPERLNFAAAMANRYGHFKNDVALLGPDSGLFDNFQGLGTAELKELIEKSEVVITRAGYTSIMELDGLNKEAILYPTKGQYEQEYLAGYICSDKMSFAQEGI